MHIYLIETKQIQIQVNEHFFLSNCQKKIAFGVQFIYRLWVSVFLITLPKLSLQTLQTTCQALHWRGQHGWGEPGYPRAPGRLPELPIKGGSHWPTFPRSGGTDIFIQETTPGPSLFFIFKLKGKKSKWTECDRHLTKIHIFE